MTDATEAEVRASNRAAYLRLAERVPRAAAAAHAPRDARSSAQWFASALPWPTREEWAARPTSYAEGTAVWLNYLRPAVRSLSLSPHAETRHSVPFAPEPRR